MIKFIKQIFGGKNNSFTSSKMFENETIDIDGSDISLSKDVQIFNAVKNDDIAYLSSIDLDQLKSYKADLDHKNIPIHFLAVFYHKSRVLEFLLQNGFSPNDYFDGSPLLEYAVLQSGDAKETILAYINNGGDVGLRNSSDQSPFEYATALNKIYLVDLFLGLGIDINERNKMGRTPLMMAATYSTIETIDYLIDRGADPRSKDHNGNTAFYYAVRKNRYKVIGHFVAKYGHSLKDLDGWGQNILFYIDSFTDLDFVKICIKEGVDLNLQDKEGNTPLHRAFHYERPDVANVLIESGALTSIKNRKNDFPSDQKSPKSVEDATWKVMELLSRLPDKLDFNGAIQVQKALTGHKFRFLDKEMPEPVHNEDGEHFSSEQRVQIMRDLLVNYEKKC